MNQSFQAVIFSIVVHTLYYFFDWTYPFIDDFLDYLKLKYHGYKVVSSTVVEFTCDDCPPDYSPYFQFFFTFIIVTLMFPLVKRLYLKARSLK